MKNILLATIIMIVNFQAFAGGDIVRQSNNKAYVAKFDSGKIQVFGKGYDTKKMCYIDDVEGVEIYTINSNGYEIAIFCVGALDGDPNYVSIFSKTKPFKTEKLNPGSSYRVSDSKLKLTIEKLSK